jgi:hypothetical protein
VRVTHPFHPLEGRQLVCVGERYTRYGTRLLLRVDEDHVCSVPRRWTDVVVPDPEIVLGEGRALLRVSDLLELADLVSRLMGQERQTDERKANNAACVKGTAPHASPRGGDMAYIDGEQRQKGAAPELDSGGRVGIIGVTNGKIACPNEATAQTPRPPRSSRRAR